MSKLKSSVVTQTTPNLRTNGAEPYHLFTVLGEHFVFDTTGRQFYKIDAMTSDILALCLNASIGEARKQMLRMDQYPEARVSALIREIRLLARHGLFERPNNYFDAIDRKKAKENFDIENSLNGLQLSLAEDCNLACRYCYCSVTRDIPSKGMMSKETARKAIDCLLSQANDEVMLTLFGGEPLLNKPVIDDIIQYGEEQSKVSGKKISYVITTNATLLDDKTIDYIVDYNFGLMVSLDGPREIHDRQCPTKAGGGSYDVAVANIRKLMEKRTVSVRATLAHPLPDFPSLVRFFNDFGFHNIVIGTATNRPEAPSQVDLTSEDMLCLTEQAELVLPEVAKAMRQNKKPPYSLYERWCGQIRDGAVNGNPTLCNCGAGSCLMGVDAEGMFYPCAKFFGMKEWQIGSFDTGRNDEKIRNIWFAFQQAIRNRCGKCWAYPVCGGPCLWDISRNDGSLKFHDRYCHYMKRNVERSAYLSWYCQADADCRESLATPGGCTI